MTAKKREMTATGLRLTLLLLIAVITALAIGGFYLVNKHLNAFATEVAEVTATAEASNSNIQRLERTETELEINKEAVARAKSIVAESTSYQYQNQIVNDLTNYAEKAGISLTGFSFGAGNGGTAGGASGTAAPAANTAAPGVKSTTVTVQMQATVPYKNYLQFIRSIEQNLTKMQISNLSLSKASEGDADTVAGQDLTIEVFIR